MSWLRKPVPTRQVSVGRRGILTMPDTYAPDEALQMARRFQDALRTSRLIVTEPGMTYTPLPARKRIRLAQAERWINT